MLFIYLIYISRRHYRRIRYWVLKGRHYHYFIDFINLINFLVDFLVLKAKHLKLYRDYWRVELSSFRVNYEVPGPDPVNLNQSEVELRTD